MTKVYRLNQGKQCDNANFDVDIERYTTSKASPEVFGLPFL